MLSSNFYTAATILAASFVQADFKVFCGNDINGLDGKDTRLCAFFTNPPSCANVENTVFHYIEADVSFSGVACDGCEGDENPADWVITRVEVNIGDYFEGPGSDHFTIRGDGGVFGMQDVDGNSVGECRVSDDRQITDCSTGISTSYLVNLFDCFTEIGYTG